MKQKPIIRQLKSSQPNKALKARAKKMKGTSVMENIHSPPPHSSGPIALHELREKISNLEEICVRKECERISYLRTLNNLTLESAAVIAGISRSELSRLENGERKLTDLHIAKLAMAYRMTVNELKDILSYQIKSKVRVISVSTASPPNIKRQLPIYLSSVLPVHGRSLQISAKAEICADIQVSDKAYAIEMDHASDDIILPPNSLIIADPSSLVRLGDLVVNTIGWRPLLMKIDRREDGLLEGTYGQERVSFKLGTALSGFHKVAAILPMAGCLGLVSHSSL